MYINIIYDVFHIIYYHIDFYKSIEIKKQSEVKTK